MKRYLGVSGIFVASCALFALGACSDDTDTNTSSNTSSSSSAASSSSSGESSSSGSSGMTSTSSSSGSSGMTSTSSSSSGNGAYTTCAECTSDASGAYTKATECKADWDKCKVDAACAALAKCSYDKCATNAEGGSCTQKCATDLGTPAASKALFCAIDNCVFCKTCTALCESPPEVSAAGYCAVTKAGVCLP